MNTVITVLLLEETWKSNLKRFKIKLLLDQHKKETRESTEYDTQ